MEKTLQFLERHCQWFAIGIGVLFLGYMVWAYTPVSPTPALAVTLPSSKAPVLPGYINATISVKSAELDKLMHAKNTGFKIDPPPVLTAWQKENALANVPTQPIPSPFYLPGANDNLNQINPGAQQNQLKVTMLPEPPPAVPQAIVQVRTVADVPANGGQGNNPAGGADAARAAANPPPATPTDVDVVSMLFTISHKDLADAFNKQFGGIPNLPQNIQQTINETLVMSVDLIREEQLPDGSWGNSTVIAPLPIHTIMALPKQQNPDSQVVINFMAWAQAHTEDILEPSYYQTEKNMPVIYSPDQPPPTVAPADPTPPPPTTPVVPVPRYTPRTNTPRTNTPRPGAGGNTGTQGRARGRNGGAMLWPSGGAAIVTVQYNPSDRPPGFGANGTPGMGTGAPPYSGPPQGPGQNNPWNQPAAPGLNANQINGKFDVTKLGSDIRIVGHDDTVVPGHTYRYHVRYTLYNSVFGIGNFANPPTLAQQFYLTSKDSAPTGPITIPTRLRFFLASIFQNKVVFDVFTWEKGKWSKSRSREMSPGDAIPGTDWSVLDVRDDLHGNGERYALLIKTDGTTERHEVTSDGKNPDFQQLENDTKSPAQANAGTRAPGF